MRCRRARVRARGEPKAAGAAMRMDGAAGNVILLPMWPRTSAIVAGWRVFVGLKAKPGRAIVFAGFSFRGLNPGTKSAQRQSAEQSSEPLAGLAGSLACPSRADGVPFLSC